MLAAIDISQLTVRRITCNQDTCDTERLRNNSMLELTVPKLITSNFESFMDNYKSAVSCMDRFMGLPLISFSERLPIITMITRKIGGRN